MSAHLDAELLESFALGSQPDASAQAHLAGCGECARELAWAKAERALFLRRPAPQSEHLWSGVAARISPQRRAHRPRWAVRAAIFTAAVAAAAAVLIIVGPVKVHLKPAGTPLSNSEVAEATPPGPDAKTLAALDRAEADYRDAAKVLEEEYARLRPQLDPKLAARWDETLTRARLQLGEARQSMVAQDVNARMRVLDGYAGYLRSLRTAVLEQEANP
jgi:hypothetical protein